MLHDACFSLLKKYQMFLLFFVNLYYLLNLYVNFIVTEINLNQPKNVEITYKTAVTDY